MGKMGPVPAPFLRASRLTESRLDEARTGDSRAAASGTNVAPNDEYPLNIPAVQALDTIEFDAVTVFAGDNGSGKSTIVEALAIAAGFNAEGGSLNLKFETHPTHSSLADDLILEWEAKPKWGWFLRAETFYGMATHIELDDDPVAGVKHIFPDFHSRSHGQSFQTLLDSRFTSAGLYILDEPESALSFQGQLGLLSRMHQLVADGAQFIVSTHSPLLMAFPGAALFELDDDGAHRTEFDELRVVELWRRFLEHPPSLLRHLWDD